MQCAHHRYFEPSHVVCPTCREEFCLNCMDQWHDASITCEEVKAQKSTDKAQLDLWVERNNAKPCPKCKVLIQKISGCNHMTCNMCKHEFCWLCFANYSPSHFQNSKCNMFGDPWRSVELPTLYPAQSTTHLVRSAKTQKKGILALPRKLFKRKRKSSVATPAVPLAHSGPIKVLLLGSSGCGKTALVTRFVSDVFYDEWEPTIEEWHHHSVYCAGETFNLNILDTSGMEEFTAFQDSWVRMNDAFVIVVDLSSEHSIDRAKDFRQRLERILDRPMSLIPCVLVGSKLDRTFQPELELSSLRQLAATLDCPLVLVSALQNLNVREVFVQIVEETTRIRQEGL